ncbi:Uncharacterized conserved protein YfiP, contains DTW domain [hydrothermal vent metagenome]|uniref:tRNA-uridine aminocarboxypropyltransferase n=1 Tax=hydrothermal vent metagenome TaxID=652676 RepID=A0A3B0X028_9ZZZZ
MQFFLLTHEREHVKKTNTGQLIRHCLPNTYFTIWQRAQPDKKLLTLIEAGNIALVYPANNTQPNNTINEFENFILIDSTWQEARKIYNRSPYLHGLPHLQISPRTTSQYKLRRNQVSGGLCTAECAIELLHAKAHVEAANNLDALFKSFMTK